MGGQSSLVCWKEKHPSKGVLFGAARALGCQTRELRSQKWNQANATVDGIRDFKLSYVAPAGREWMSVLLRLNSSIWESLPREVSRNISGAAIVFVEFDRAAWGYVLYQEGKETDRFWSHPRRARRKPSECRGNARLLAKTFGVRASELEPYLHHVGHEAQFARRAFRDDEFQLNDHWVRVDFMKRLGIRYPNPGNTRGGAYLLIQEPKVKPPAAPKPERREISKAEPSRTWWRFWEWWG